MFFFFVVFVVFVDALASTTHKFPIIWNAVLNRSSDDFARIFLVIVVIREIIWTVISSCEFKTLRVVVLLRPI